MEGLNGKRLFIVEDDVTNMTIFNASLKPSGATVICDYWNDETLKLLRQSLPLDGILLDLRLRYGISGYDIYEQLRAEPELAQVPVVIVSASDPDLEVPKAKAQGFAGFIRKPIKLRDFPAQIARCIQEEPLWGVEYE
jgi:two-component system cell cycle response regulator DivK